MGTLTTTELVSETRAHLGGRDDLTDAELVVALNLTQMRIARSHDFEELRTVESGVFVISGTPATDKFLAFSTLGQSNPREIYSFRVITNDGRSRKLIAKPVRKFDEDIPEPEFYATGLPIQYAMWAEKFEFWRVPDTADNYDIRMSFWPTALVVSPGTAVSEFKEKDDMIINLGVSYLYGRLGEYERAGRFWNIFREMWKSARMEDQLRPDLVISSGYSRTQPAGQGKPWADPFVKRT